MEMMEPAWRFPGRGVDLFQAGARWSSDGRWNESHEVARGRRASPRQHWAPGRAQRDETTRSDCAASQRYRWPRVPASPFPGTANSSAYHPQEKLRPEHSCDTVRGRRLATVSLTAGNPPPAPPSGPHSMPPQITQWRRLLPARTSSMQANPITRRWRGRRVCRLRELIRQARVPPSSSCAAPWRILAHPCDSLQVLVHQVGS